MIRTDSNLQGHKVLIFEFVSGGGMANETLPHSWLSEGQAMLEAAIRAFDDIGCQVVTTVDARLNLRLPAEIHKIDRPQKVADILSEIQLRTKAGLLIAPETAGILHQLSSRADVVPGWNLGSTAPAVALCGDKLATGRHLHSLKLPHPIARPAASRELPRSHDARFIVKPVDGAGTVDTFLVEAYKLNSFFDRHAADTNRLLIQPYIPGKSAGLSFLIGACGSVVDVAASIHEVRIEPLEPGVSQLKLDSGKPADDIHADVFEQTSNCLRTIPGLRGWIGVDVILDATGKLAAILEINPRLTSSFVWTLNRTGRSIIASRWLATSDRYPL